MERTLFKLAWDLSLYHCSHLNKHAVHYYIQDSVSGFISLNELNWNQLLKWNLILFMKISGRKIFFPRTASLDHFFLPCVLSPVPKTFFVINPAVLTWAHINKKNLGVRFKVIFLFFCNCVEHYINTTVATPTIRQHTYIPRERSDESSGRSTNGCGD